MGGSQANPAVEHFRQLVEERHAAVKDALNALWDELGGQGLAAKVQAAESLGDNLRRLGEVVLRAHQPSWIKGLQSGVAQYKADQRKPAVLVRVLLKYTPEVEKHEWGPLIDPDFRSVDFEEVEQHARASGDRDAIFEELLAKVVEAIESGELGDRAVEEGLRVLISLLKRQRGRGASRQSLALKCLWWWLEERAKVWLEESENGKATVRTYERYQDAVKEEEARNQKAVIAALGIDRKLIGSGYANLDRTLDSGASDVFHLLPGERPGTPENEPA